MCALTWTCLPVCRCGEIREITTWTLPSLCSEPLRLDSWVGHQYGSAWWATSGVADQSCWSKWFTAPCGKTWIMFYFLPGEALLESNTVIDFVYCSPSLRCVQTAQNILKGKNRIGNSLTFAYVLSLVCYRGPLWPVVWTHEPFLCQQVCSRTGGWRWGWSQASLNGPSGFLGILCLRGFLPQSWQLPTSV